MRSVHSPAGGTESSLTNSLRIFVSYTPLQTAHTTFRKLFPDPAHCTSLPSPLSCTCVPSQAVRVDHLSRDHYVLYDPDAGAGSSGAAHCASVVPSSDFQQETHSENGTTAPRLDVDGTPALEESPFSSFERWFHGGEMIVLETPRLVTPKDTLLYGLWGRFLSLTQRRLLPSSTQ